MLVDRQIRRAIGTGDVIISPYDPEAVQPASYDLHMGETVTIPRGRGVLSCTLERVTLSPQIAGWILMNSTPARQGLTSATALWFDPGWDGVPTIELHYWGSLDPALYDHPDYQTAVLKKGTPICQMIFFRATEPADFPYGHPVLNSRYQHQSTTTPARLR